MADAPMNPSKPPAETLDPVAAIPSTDEQAIPPKPTLPPTAEEQMAAFEESLKESDWGHQPC